MLKVLTPEEVLKLIESRFSPLKNSEEIPVSEAAGRVLAADIGAEEYVPDFSRSTVDGYALLAQDTFGCSDSIPAILPVCGEVFMGRPVDFTMQKESCCAVPTGGEVPPGCDSVVMIEYTENYGDGTVGILKPASPGQNMIFRGDDVFPGKILLKEGRTLTPQDIGALSAVGKTAVPVQKKLKIGILSTGDELVPPEETPGPGQVRDVNSPMLAALFSEFGAEAVRYGIVRDDEAKLRSSVEKMAAECDMVILSGGSSVGVKDAACRIIESLGEILFHGIAIKPGKPTIFGVTSGGKPVVGLPGHPVAAYFVSRLFVLPLAARLQGKELRPCTVKAFLSENVEANHGRAQCMGVNLREEEGKTVAVPVHSKSGLITTLAGTDGYFCISRDCEGLPKGKEIEVTLC